MREIEQKKREERDPVQTCLTLLYPTLLYPTLLYSTLSSLGNSIEAVRGSGADKPDGVRTDEWRGEGAVQEDRQGSNDADADIGWYWYPIPYYIIPYHIT